MFLSHFGADFQKNGDLLFEQPKKLMAPDYRCTDI